MQQKTTFRGRRLLCRLILATALGVTGCGSGGTTFSNDNDNTPTEADAVKVKEYKHSVGYWIPDSSDTDEISDEVKAKTVDLGLSVFLKFGLEVSTGWVGMVASVIKKIPSAGGGYAETMDYYVKTKASSSWQQSIEICPDDEVLASLIYYPGTYSTASPHKDGLEIGVYKWALGGYERVDSVTLLEAGEETSDNPPNFFVAKTPISLAEFVDTTLPIDQIFAVGYPEAITKITVDLNSSDCDDSQSDDSSNDETDSQTYEDVVYASASSFTPADEQDVISANTYPDYLVVANGDGTLPRSTALVQFDLHGSYSGRTVLKADLVLYLYDDSSMQSVEDFRPGIARNARNWNEDSLTWSNADWEIDGSDVGETSYGTTANTEMTWDVTEAVQHWVGNPSENYGLVITALNVPSSDGYGWRENQRTFWSSRSNYSPELRIVYEEND